MLSVLRVALAALLAAAVARAAGNCTDGVLNNNETQVDCGGESEWCHAVAGSVGRAASLAWRLWNQHL